MYTPEQIRGLIIPAGGEPAYLSTFTPDLDTMRALVGGNLQIIGLTKDSVMWVNEDGKRLGLPVNAEATILASAAEAGLMPGDLIAGQVFVAGVLNREGRHDGQDHDTPVSVLDLCASAGVVVEDRTTYTDDPA